MDLQTVLLTHEPLEGLDWASFVGRDEAGAISTFIGTTRNSFNGKRVVKLEYEAYEKMALNKLNHLRDMVFKQWGDIHEAIIWHRLGDVPVGKASVIIAVSSTHRASSLAAVAWAIDELKAIVPIFKREWYDDGSEWKGNCESCVKKSNAPPLKTVTQHHVAHATGLAQNCKKNECSANRSTSTSADTLQIHTVDS